MYGCRPRYLGRACATRVAPSPGRPATRPSGTGPSRRPDAVVAANRSTFGAPDGGAAAPSGARRPLRDERRGERFKTGFMNERRVAKPRRETPRRVAATAARAPDVRVAAALHRERTPRYRALHDRRHPWHKPLAGPPPP